MAKYLWKGLSPEGERKAESVEASSPKEARRVLEERGWKELTLLTEDVQYYAGKGVESASDPEYSLEEEAPEVQVERLYGRGPGFWSGFWDSLTSSPKLNLLGLVLLCWGIYRRGYIMASAGAVILLIFPVLYAVFSLPGRYYAAIQTAKVWGRWDEVERLLDKLARVTSWTKLGIGEVEMVRTRAMAMAHKGRVEEGVAAFESMKGDPNLPEWLFYSHLGSVYDEGKKHEAALRVREKATELEPENASNWIDVAFSSVRFLNLPEKARLALKRAEDCEMNEMGQKYLPFVWGMVHWREREFEQAKEAFQEAVENFKALAGATPLVEGLTLLSKSYLCASQRALGNGREANRLWKQVERFLSANGDREQELFSACRPEGRALSV